MKRILWLIFVLLIVGIVNARVESFYYPSVKDDYCGLKIGATYCKCAFHNKYCDSIGMDKRSANKKVMTGFKAYVKEQISMFAGNCQLNDGIYSVKKRQCTYCENGKVPVKGVCADPNDKRSIAEQYGLPDNMPESEGSITQAGWISEAEGEIFLWSPGRGKWIGPIKKGRTIFQGDIIITKSGRGTIRFGGSESMYINDRTYLKIPIPREPRHILVRGMIHIWENIKRIARNEPMEVEAGHSISSIKGTEFIIEVDENGDATYTVNEGIVEVWNKDNPSEKVELNAGESVIVTENNIQDNPYEWDTLIEEYDLSDRDKGEVEEFEMAPYPIDPDNINPSEAAYTGEIYGKIKTSGGFPFFWVIFLILLGGSYFLWRKLSPKK